MLSQLPGFQASAIVALAVLLLYATGIVTYRLYFHPLRHFPGPKLNAATLWVDTWYDVIQPGQFTFKLKEYHEKYGPIMRINPNELHIMDSEFYDEIYTSSIRPRDKYEWWQTMMGEQDQAGFSATSFELHRMRRGLLNPYFSKKTIQTDGLPIIKANLAKLVHRFRKIAQTGEVARIDVAFMALTLDVIYEYCLDIKTNYVLEDDFHEIWHRVNRAGFKGMAMNRHFPWFARIMNRIPVSVMLRVIPVLGHFLLRHGEVKADVDKVWYTDENKQILRDADDMPRRNVIHAMRDAPHMPAAERTPERVVDEAFALIGGGSEAVARAMSLAAWYMMATPEVLPRLRTELMTVIEPGKTLEDVPYNILENLPYLSAVVSESLRLSYGVVSRLPRVLPPSTDERLVYKGWEIPKGVAFSMSGYYVHNDPNIFPEPTRFNPDRWLVPDDDEDKPAFRRVKYNVALKRFLVTFSKGQRACLGINLAYCEIYLSIAVFAMYLFGDESECGFELYDTDFERDVKCTRDYFTNLASDDTKGMRIRSRRASTIPV